MAGNRKRLLRLLGVLVAAAISLLIWSRRPPVEQAAHRRLGPPRLAGPAARGFAPNPAGSEALSGLGVDGGGRPVGARELTLSGQVLDAGGGFIAGAHVRATTYVRRADDTHEARVFQATADAEGRYQLRLPPGWHTLRAEADGYVGAEESRDVYADLTRDFALQPAARVSGRVVAADSRAPVADARVFARREDRQLDASPRTARTDDRGRFLLSELTPGVYRISARTDALAGTLDQPIAVDVTDAVDGVEVLVAAMVTVQGRVTSATGGPVAQAEIALSAVDPPLRALAPDSVVTDAEGHYLIEGVVPGRYRFAVLARGHASHSERIFLSSHLRRDVVLERAAVVTGFVLRSDGQPASQAWVVGTVGPPNVCRDVSSQTLTDGEGRFSLAGLGAGELTMKATHDEEAAMVGPERLGPFDQKDVTIRLGAGAGVTGVARWEDGSPIAAEAVMTVMTFAQGSRVRVGARTAPDGSFAIRGLPPGEISLQVDPTGSVPGRLDRDDSGRATLTLRPGEQKTGVELVVARR
jgi:hypothetical protein